MSDSDQLVTSHERHELAPTPEWLDDMADRVRHSLGSAAYGIYQAGVDLREVQDTLGYGSFTVWVEGNFPFTPKTAHQYIRVSEYLDDRVPQEQIPKLTASTSAIDALTSQDLPDDVRDEMTTRLLEGQRLTVDMIKGAAEAAMKSEQRAEVLLEVDERVVDIAERLDMEPDVIAALDELRFADYETFEEVEASGCVYDTEGAPIPLDEANGRDVTAYINHTRFERQMGGLARSGAMSIVINNHKPLANRAVYIKTGLIQKQHFHEASEAVIKAIDEQIGELVGPYEEQIDIVFTAYFLRRPLRSSEIFIRGYEEGLYHAGVIRGDGPDFINSVKVRSRSIGRGEPRFEIDIYPRAQRES